MKKAFKLNYPDSHAQLEAIVLGISSLFQTRVVLINVTNNTSVQHMSISAQANIMEQLLCLTLQIFAE